MKRRLMIAREWCSEYCEEGTWPVYFAAMVAVVAWLAAIVGVLLVTSFLPLGFEIAGGVVATLIFCAGLATILYLAQD